jgi:hypothetical protein
MFNHGQVALSMDVGVYIPVTDSFFMLYAVVTWIVSTGRILLYQSVLNVYCGAVLCVFGCTCGE